MSFETGADDPFAEDDSDEAEDDQTLEESGQSTEITQSESSMAEQVAPDASVETRDPREIARQLTPEAFEGERVPYVTWRDGTSDHRKKMYIDVSESAMAMEKQAKRLVENELESDISKADLREFALAYAYHHPEALAEMAREWGLNY